jgi:uncharacterized protein GlcG (DUF336 family)
MTVNAPEKTFSAPSITRETALALLVAAREAAEAIGITVTIAVTDAAGHLKAFERADGAPFLTVDVAVDKAWTAASFGLSTHVWNAILGDSKVAQLAHRPRMVSVGGGCPILLEGQLVGAIGISGGNALEDQQAAETALGALGFDVQA